MVKTKEKKKSKYGSLRAAVAAGKQQLERPARGGALNISGVEFWRPKKGTALFDIIPYEVTIKNHPAGIKVGDLYQQLAYKVHYGVGSDDKTVTCPTSVGKPCPICSRRAELYKDPNASEEEIADLKAKDRVVFNVIDLNDEAKGIQIFDFSPHLFANKMYEEIEAADGEFESVFDLDAGFTIKARFTEKKLGKNVFVEASRVDFEERDPYDDDIVEDAVDLDTALNILDYKTIEALFLDLDPEVKDETEEEEETPPPRTRGARGQRQSEPEPEEEEEAPEPPKRSRKKAEPEPDPEEEDEPAPPPRTRRGKTPEPEPEPEEDVDDDEQCPHGLKFGLDCEQDDRCDQCDIWEDCKDAFEAAEAKKKGGRKRK